MASAAGPKKMASERPTILIIGGTGAQGMAIPRGKVNIKGFRLLSALDPAESTISAFRHEIQTMFARRNLQIYQTQRLSLVVLTMKQISVVHLKVSPLHSLTPMVSQSAKRLRFTGA
jgi:hypothetical protein